MPDCQQFQNEVNRLTQVVNEQRDECARLTDIEQKKGCLQELGRLQDQLSRAQEALRNCQRGLPSPGVQEAQGHITFLRVHDVGTGWGPPNDFLDVEAIFLLDTQPNRAFGFQLRNDSARPAREGMLALLQDAFANDLNVIADYMQVLNKHNAVAFRIAITRRPI
jgi:hypothetical protein